jgi:two-component system response regulator NreC
MTEVARSSNPTRYARAHTVLVDDHPLFRLGLQEVLRREPDVELVGEAHNAADVMKLAQHLRLDVAVVDMVMPGVDGISLTAELHHLQPQCKILGLSVVDEPVRIAEMLRAGASGYALKTQPVSEIIEAIRTILGGIRYLSPGVSSDEIDALASTDHQPFARLTGREREVFDRLVRGEPNSVIAATLVISRRTVETHRQRIMKKLGAHSIVELLQVAARHGLIGN